MEETNRIKAGMQTYNELIKNGFTLPTKTELFEIIRRSDLSGEKERGLLNAVYFAFRCGIGVGYNEGVKNAR